MIEKFFTTEQVANILQVHPFTILKFLKEGKLKGVKLGRVYRIKESDVVSFLDERMTKSGNKKTKIQEEPSITPQIPHSEVQHDAAKPEPVPTDDAPQSYQLNRPKGETTEDNYYLI